MDGPAGRDFDPARARRGRAQARPGHADRRAEGAAHGDRRAGTGLAAGRTAAPGGTPDACPRRPLSGRGSGRISGTSRYGANRSRRSHPLRDFDRVDVDLEGSGGAQSPRLGAGDPSPHGSLWRSAPGPCRSSGCSACRGASRAGPPRWGSASRRSPRPRSRWRAGGCSSAAPRARCGCLSSRAAGR